MKTPKLYKMAKQYLSGGAKKTKHQKTCIKEILKKLKHKQRKLKDKLAKEKSAKARKHIEHDLGIIFAQRQKGLKTLKSLK